MNYFKLFSCLLFHQFACKESELTNISLSNIKTNKGVYETGETVSLATFSLKNKGEESLSILGISAKVIRFATPDRVEYNISLSKEITIDAGEDYDIPTRELFKIPSSLAKDSYGVYITINPVSGSKKVYYTTFFRVGDAKTQVNYQIEKEIYQSFPVFKLKNGLSAEYAVQKSAASFVSGIAHSWFTPLAPIASTPDFLERSLNKTVIFYDETIGASTPVKTVLIAPGSPGVPYLARAMNALVLPLHYLVGCSTVKEARTILKHANSQGHSVYGTLGYDYSISNNTGVAWIKMLALPRQYIDFIKRHQVKNVILLGHAGVNDGETIARKVHDSTTKIYDEGALHLMHFSGSASEGYLKQTIRDFEQTILDPKVRIADWEAGIISEQIDGIIKGLKTRTSVTSITTITANKGVSLWNLGTYVSLALIYKNKGVFSKGGDPVRGISLNPYLIAHPTAESWFGYVPFLYWQGTSPSYQYNSALNTTVRNAIQSYFPAISFDKLNFWVNSTANFGGVDQAKKMVDFLRGKGFKVIHNDYDAKEVFDISDGMNAPVEKRLKKIVDAVSSTAYKRWNESLQHLTPEDLKDIGQKFSDIVVRQR